MKILNRRRVEKRGNGNFAPTRSEHVTLRNLHRLVL